MGQGNRVIFMDEETETGVWEEEIKPCVSEEKTHAGVWGEGSLPAIKGERETKRQD